MIDTARLPSKRVTAFAVAVVIALVGVILAVRVASRPAYQATAQITLGFRSEGLGANPTGYRPPSRAFVAALNHEVDEVLESIVVVGRAAILLSEAASSVDDDGPFVEKNFSTDVRASGLVEIKFRADDAEVARLGANAVVEAYRELGPGAPHGELLGREWEITGVFLAPTPTRRADTLNTADVSWFLLASMLAVYLTWRWWPDLQQQAARSDRLLRLAGVVSLLVGVFTGYIWLLALAFALGVWSVIEVLDNAVYVRLGTAALPWSSGLTRGWRRRGS